MHVGAVGHARRRDGDDGGGVVYGRDRVSSGVCGEEELVGGGGAGDVGVESRRAAAMAGAERVFNFDRAAGFLAWGFGGGGENEVEDYGEEKSVHSLSRE